LEPIKIAYHWSGNLDVVPRSFPKLVELDEDCLAVFGFSGRGVPTGTALGLIVAEWASGKPAAELALPIEAPQPRSKLLQPALKLALPLSRMRDQLSAWRHGIMPPRY
jgi:glycine/D-amino acid oxidase-like deaminating enzyme